MNPVILPDRRGKSAKITAEMVRRVIDAAKEIKAKGHRLRLKSFAKQLETEQKIALSRKKISEILIANGLYKVNMKRRRPRFYQRIRQSIPNGLVSVDGSEFSVWIDQVPYKFNLELSVDVESFCHTGFSVSESETSEEFIKVMEIHKDSWGLPLGIVADHGSANLSTESKAYLERNDIEILPVGPANAKGNGTCEVAFSEIKEVIGSIELGTSSPRQLAKRILEKMVSVYITMRNRLPRFGEENAVQDVIKTPVSQEEVQRERERIKKRKQKEPDPSREAKLDRLDWIIRHNNLEVDEQSFKRAQKCIVTYDLKAIAKSEEAFLKAIRRNQDRRNAPYFFGILSNIQDEMDTAKHEDYCRRLYHYQQMVDKERENEDQDKGVTTVENLVVMLRNAVLSDWRFIKEACIKQAKRIAQNLKKQYHYIGVLKQKISDTLGEVKELSLSQRKEIFELAQQLLT